METALAEPNSHLGIDACVAGNSRLGFRAVFAGMYPAIDEVKPKIASGIGDESRREDIRSRSTGKERDQESGLDYFLARYYSGAQGRFTSPDPENRGAKVPDPQSWNMYAYARNNPLRYTDPNGETYRVCQAGFEGQDENCGDISDEQFASFRKTQSLRFVGGNKGAIYSGNNLLGSFKQTDVDLPMDVSLALHAAGVTADREFKNAVADVAIGVATGAVAGAVVGGIAKGLEAAPELLPFKDTDLIRRVGQALERIGKGVKQFRNIQERRGFTPFEGAGYYSEYTVQPPTGAGRGVERLVVGQGGEVYHTPNHYGSFVRIK